mmetsp:Transcript_74169/g.158930  ORF Transcript_74169/g.158930 Transcript_74169/m.158930 type:complete len:200 (+) Transcript_74169:1065-1664(+)
MPAVMPTPPAQSPPPALGTTTPTHTGGHNSPECWGVGDCLILPGGAPLASSTVSLGIASALDSTPATLSLVPSPDSADVGNSLEQRFRIGGCSISSASLLMLSSPGSATSPLGLAKRTFEGLRPPIPLDCAPHGRPAHVSCPSCTGRIQCMSPKLSSALPTTCFRARLLGPALATATLSPCEHVCCHRALPTICSRTRD